MCLFVLLEGEGVLWQNAGRGGVGALSRGHPAQCEAGEQEKAEDERVWSAGPENTAGTRHGRLLRGPAYRVNW